MNNNDLKYSTLPLEYVLGKTTPEETAIVEKWAKENTANQEHLDLLKTSFNNAGEDNQDTFVNTDFAWTKVNAKLSDIRIHPIAKSNPSMWLTYTSSIAAILIIGFIAAWYLLKSNKEAIHVASNNNINMPFTLGDGSHIYLNRNSVIEYPKYASTLSREVYLKKGEAFFDVKHDEHIPFIIHAKDMEVQVMGTSFSVKIDSISNNVSVVVKSGTVLFYRKGENIHKLSETNYISASQQCISNSKDFSLKKQTEKRADTLISWHTRILIFNETPIPAVITKLESTYNVTFDIKNAAFNACKLTAQFENKSIDEIIEALEFTFTVTIKKNNNIITIDGKGC